MPIELPLTVKGLDRGCALDTQKEETTEMPRCNPTDWRRFDSVSLNRGIQNIRPPVGLKHIIMTSGWFGFGCSITFNQGLSGMMRPPDLEVLALGDEFNHSMWGTTFSRTAT